MPSSKWLRLTMVMLCAGAVVVVVGPAVGAPATQPTGAAASAPSPAPVVVVDSRTLTPAEAGRGTDEKEILVVQALDQPTNLTIQDMPICDAMRLLAEKTGVPIEFDRFVLGCLPYGSKTLVTAKIENQSLRDSLGALLRPLACKYGLIEGKVVIQPRPALFRICRRATWDEVTLIEKLYATDWSKALADSLDFQFQDMSAADSDANRKKFYELAESVGAGHAARVLELATHQYGWQWHPEGPKTVVFCTRTRQVELQLQRLISAQYSEVQIKDVLLDLAGRAGLLLKMEPGVLASLPTQQAERFRMHVENVTIRQAFELIAGETGLGYFIEPDGIRITANTVAAGSASSSEETAARTVQALRANSIVGQITVPGENGPTFFIREQDL
ncbi:MAG: hypothetical protein HY718_11310, partial [Planctomycetes bacterium]|nr:hypothetical protein [Planctomycetota bacterium]